MIPVLVKQATAEILHCPVQMLYVIGPAITLLTRQAIIEREIVVLSTLWKVLVCILSLI